MVNGELLDGVCNPVRNVYFLVPKRREGRTESMRGKVQRFHGAPQRARTSSQCNANHCSAIIAGAKLEISLVMVDIIVNCE